jgi:hypothetical protein
MSKKHKGGSVHPIERQIISPDRIFYWAYGSNLCERQMARRCPDAIKFGPMEVQDCALIFRGAADVTVRRGTATSGGLWQITTRCERELDAYEGVSSRHYMKKYFQIRIAKKPYTCLFYQMRTSDGIMPPTERYIDTIAEGYRDFGLDLERLDAALQESWGTKKITEKLADRHWRKGNPKLARDIAGMEKVLPPETPPPAPFTDEELADMMRNAGEQSCG